MYLKLLVCLASILFILFSEASEPLLRSSVTIHKKPQNNLLYTNWAKKLGTNLKTVRKSKDQEIEETIVLNQPIYEENQEVTNYLQEEICKRDFIETDDKSVEKSVEEPSRKITKTPATLNIIKKETPSAAVTENKIEKEIKEEQLAEPEIMKKEKIAENNEKNQPDEEIIVEKKENPDNDSVAKKAKPQPAIEKKKEEKIEDKFKGKNYQKIMKDIKKKSRGERL